MDLEEKYLELSNGKIFSMIAGDPSSPVVLCIHGWSQRNGWHTWQPLMAPLAEAGFFIVSVDMPGWGKSPGWTSGSIPTEMAVDAVASIIQVLGQDSAVLMGKSWGGGVAIETALRYSSNITGLILTAPAFRNIEKLKQLSQTVLLAWAEDDPVIPIGYAHEYQTRIPSLKFVSYPTGGHSAAPKNAGAFVPIAVEFLKSLSSPSQYLERELSSRSIE